MRGALSGSASFFSRSVFVCFLTHKLNFTRGGEEEKGKLVGRKIGLKISGETLACVISEMMMNSQNQHPSINKGSNLKTQSNL